MVEFSDVRQGGRAFTSSGGDEGLSGQIFGDGKRDRQRDEERPRRDDPARVVQPQQDRRPGRQPFDFTPPQVRPGDRVQPEPVVNPPGGNRRDQIPPSIGPKPGDNNPGGRDRVPNFPNFPAVVQPRPDVQPNPGGNQPRPGDNRPGGRDRIPNFPDIVQPRPEVNPTPSVRPRDTSVQPGSRIPGFPGIPGAQPRPGDGNVTPSNVAPRLEFPDLRPRVRPTQPTDQRTIVQPTVPSSDTTFRPAVAPTDQVRPGQRIVPPGGLDSVVRDLLPGQRQPGFQPGTIRPDQQYQPRKPDAKQIIADLLIGPQTPRYNPNYPYRPDHNPQYNPNYPNNPGYDPNFRPEYPQAQPATPRGILGEVVRDLIDPNARNRPQYDPRFNPNYDPRFNPGYRPGFQPRSSPVQAIIGEVVRDLIAPSSGPCYPPSDCGPAPYYPQVGPQPYQPYSPGMYPTDLNPNRFPTGRLGPDGPVRNFIRQGLRNNPQALEGILNTLGTLSQDVRFNVNRETGEVNLAMDFTKAYDMISQKQGTPQNPEIRRVLAGLDSVQLSANAMALNWKGEQSLSLGDQAQGGPAKDFRILLGGGTNRTTFNIDSTETQLTLSNIQGLEAVDPSGRRIRVHHVQLDSTDPAAPKGSITLDNPVPKPAQLPANTPWPEQVALPIVLSGEQNKQMADALPGMIRTINSARNAANSGDLSQLMSNINPQDLSKLFDMLKQPRTQPINPLVPPPPQPGIRPDAPPSPQPSIRSDEFRPPEVRPQPAPGSPGSELLAPPPAVIDTHPAPVQPGPADTLKPGERRLGGNSILGGGSLASLFAPSLNRDRTKPVAPAAKEGGRPIIAKVDYLDVFPAPATPTTRPEATPVAPPSADKTAIPIVPAKTLPATGDSTIIPGTTNETNRRSFSSDLVGGRLEGPGKIGPDKLFSLIFADADQQGPLVKGFNQKLTDTNFRRNLESVGNTLNRYEVDKQRRAITVGLDFAKAYDTFENDPSKKKPETVAFLQGLDTVTLTPDQLRLKFNGPSKLAMEGEGMKKADLWMGTNNGETTFDIESTDTNLKLKNITGLQAEVKILGKRLNVHEVNIDTSTGTPSAIVTVDNPFDKPPGVTDNMWQKTISLSLDLGKTPEEQAEVNARLPQTLRSLNSMRQGAANGQMAERIGNLTRDQIIAMLKFQ